MSGAASSRRGRTSAGRLRALDRYVLEYERALLLHGEGPFIDVGFGDEPLTTLASAEAFRAVRPELEVIGVERDPARAQGARSPGLKIVTGDFTALPALGPARLVRVMNVLRGYREEELPAAYEQLFRTLGERGLGLEGSSNPSGSLLCAYLLRGGRREALLFSTDFEEGFAPMQFRDWLPRALRRRVRPGEAIFDFLSAWKAAWEQTRAPFREDPPAAFAASAEAVSGFEVSLLWPGCLRWRLP